MVLSSYEGCISTRLLRKIIMISWIKFLWPWLEWPEHFPRTCLSTIHQLSNVYGLSTVKPQDVHKMNCSRMFQSLECSRGTVHHVKDNDFFS